MERQLRQMRQRNAERLAAAADDADRDASLGPTTSNTFDAQYQAHQASSQRSSSEIAMAGMAVDEAAVSELKRYGSELMGAVRGAEMSYSAAKATLLAVGGELGLAKEIVRDNVHASAAHYGSDDRGAGTRNSAPVVGGERSASDSAEPDSGADEKGFVFGRVDDRFFECSRGGDFCWVSGSSNGGHQATPAGYRVALCMAPIPLSISQTQVPSYITLQQVCKYAALDAAQQLSSSRTLLPRSCVHTAAVR